MFIIFVYRRKSAFIMSPCCRFCNLSCSSFSSSSLRLNSNSSFLIPMSLPAFSYRNFTAVTRCFEFEHLPDSFPAVFSLFLVSEMTENYSTAFKRTSSAFCFWQSIFSNFASFSISAVASWFSKYSTRSSIASSNSVGSTAIPDAFSSFYIFRLNFVCNS